MSKSLPFVIALAAGVLIAALAGCDFGDLVRVKTPAGIRASEGLPAALSLNDAEHEYANWIAAVRNDAMRWSADITRADEIADLLGQMALQSLEDAGPTLAGVPVLGPALPGLTLLAGLLIRRPGDRPRAQVDAEIAAEKQKAADAAWDQAKREALEEFTRIAMANKNG